MPAFRSVVWLGFNVKVTVKSPNGKKETKSLGLNSEKNLFAVVKKLFPAMKFKLDEKFGAEVSEIEGLKKSERAGLHFTINGQVPINMVNGQKLYCALYHVQANKDMKVVLELVSVSCDFSGSIVKPMLDYRSRKWILEPLEDMTNPRIYKVYAQNPPWQTQDAFLGFYLQQLAFRAGNFGAFPSKLRQKERGLELPRAFTGQVFGQRNQASAVQPFASNEIPGWRFPQHDVMPENPMPFFEPPSRAADEAGAPPQESPGNPAGRSLSGSGKAEGVGAAVGGKSIRAGGAGSSGEQSEGSKGGPEDSEGGKSSWASKAGSPGWQGEESSDTDAERKGRGGKFKPIPLSSLKDFKAAIFDLDGVVVDSEAAHLLSFNKLLSPLSVKITEKMWRENYAGVGSLAILKDVFARNGIKEDVRVWMAARAEIYHDVVVKTG